MTKEAERVEIRRRAGWDEYRINNVLVAQLPKRAAPKLSEYLKSLEGPEWDEFDKINAPPE